VIYLDNAATSYPKPEKVYEEMNRCLREYCANPGRGGHAMSLTSGRAVLEARDALCRFFNIGNPMQLCFTKNATEAINLAIRGSLKQGDHVITTSMEHNSVIRPLKTLERDLSVEITVIRGNEWGEIDPEQVEKSLRPNTRLVVSTLSSNVNGIIMPVRDIGTICSGHGALFLLDASQGAGSVAVDVADMHIDMLAFPGHKGLMGPQGTGGLYVREDLKLVPLMQGGTGSNSENLYQPEFLPDMLESGTLNTPGIVGLGQGVEFVNSFGIGNLAYLKHLLVKKLYEGISCLKGIKLYSRMEQERNSGIIAFNFEEVDSTEISYVLDKAYGIASRAGLHCAPLAHETLGTLRSGVVRLSVGCFNTQEEMDRTIEALEEISRSL
jgi:cysteine desulfurase / selenocysteine lyase